MDIRIVKTPISVAKVTELAAQQFGIFVKATVDLDKKIMALGGDLHADEEEELLKKGSNQQNLWGVNLYPDKHGTSGFIEYDSMINIRPSQGNMSRGVEDLEIRRNIEMLIRTLVTKENGR